MIVLAIDPGVKNFAISIEHVCCDTLSAVDDMETKLECAQTIFFNTFTITDGSTREVTRVLDTLEHLWKTCTVILVERQMQFRGTVNTKALRIAHHCLTYFELRHTGADVIDYQASNKTRVLGAPKGMTKPQRKKWSVAKTGDVLRARGDIASLEKRGSMGRKLDDVSDCMLMCLSYAVIETNKRKKVKKSHRRCNKTRVPDDI